MPIGSLQLPSSGGGPPEPGGLVLATRVSIDNVQTFTVALPAPLTWLLGDKAAAVQVSPAPAGEKGGVGGAGSCASTGVYLGDTDGPCVRVVRCGQ